jgi:transcriptional regulator with XRE-family HTH domain
MFPVIDIVATGKNIERLRRRHGQSVKDLQEYFGFDQPQAIYKWQWGKALPSVDNLYALSVLWGEPINGILVEADQDAVHLDEFYSDIKGHANKFGKPAFKWYDYE